VARSRPQQACTAVGLVKYPDFEGVVAAAGDEERLGLEIGLGGKATLVTVSNHLE
jgi:hypothetical protein